MLTLSEKTALRLVLYISFGLICLQFAQGSSILFYFLPFLAGLGKYIFGASLGLFFVSALLAYTRGYISLNLSALIFFLPPLVYYTLHDYVYQPGPISFNMNVALVFLIVLMSISGFNNKMPPRASILGDCLVILSAVLTSMVILLAINLFLNDYHILLRGIRYHPEKYSSIFTANSNTYASVCILACLSLLTLNSKVPPNSLLLRRLTWLVFTASAVLLLYMQSLASLFFFTFIIIYLLVPYILSLRALHIVVVVAGMAGSLVFMLLNGQLESVRGLP